MPDIDPARLESVLLARISAWEHQIKVNLASIGRQVVDDADHPHDTIVATREGEAIVKELRNVYESARRGSA